MTSDGASTYHFPYAGLLPPLLDSIFDALKDLAAADGEYVPDAKLNGHFTWLKSKPRGQDPHLFLSPIADKSLRTEGPDPPDHPTRISNLLRLAFASADKHSSPGVAAFLPSPLRILHSYLTVPDEPETSAYSFVTMRAYLFQSLKLCPAGQRFPAHYVRFSYSDIEDAVSTIQTYIAGRDNIPLGGSPAKVLVAHVMAMKGLLNLRFGAREKSAIDALTARHAYCEHRQLVASEFEFRIGDEIAKVPEAGELINELWGVPLPIRGADTVFFGGLKFAADGGGVIAITGAPGTGKTSISLALAVALAPLGTRTFFLTGEESQADLDARLATLTPTYLPELSIAIRRREEWFSAQRVALFRTGHNEPPGLVLKRALNEIEGALNNAGIAESRGMPLPCPLMIVFDGIQTYLSNAPDQIGRSEYTIQELVDDCRRLGALIVFTAAEDRPELGALDYLVDIALRLEYRNTQLTEDKPIRVLVLRKTRLQLSRPGAHIAHLSGPKGFRLAPQLPSQLDRRAVMKVGLPDENIYLDFLNRPFTLEALARIDLKRAIRNPRLDRTWPAFMHVLFRSFILLHGRGSSGKSGLALKMLMAPRFNSGTTNYVNTFHTHRILVVSFLYPKSYYDDLSHRLQRLVRHEYRGFSRRYPPIDVLHFTPGFLNPEDLFHRINAYLDQGELEGEPHDGVLLDGLHNVFLQFPRLAKNSMVWPMLYGMLRTRNVTVVTTHTTFNVAGGAVTESADLIMDEARPLLHALVQASDYYFEIERPKKRPLRDSREDFEVTVRGSITPVQSPDPLYWNRERLVFHTGIRQPELFSHHEADEDR
jgi:hypothetical protein